MNKRFYFLRLSVGMAILLSALSAPYFFTFSRSHVAASSAQAETIAPVAFQTGCSTASYSPAPTSPEPAGNNPHYIAAGDLNGDGHQDIVSTNFDAASVTILMGDGTGNFTILGGPISVGLEPVTAEIGDYNNDNKPDIAICNQNSDSVHILLGNGTGAFTVGSPILVGDAPRTVVKGYFNNDANLDLATTNGGSNNLTILLGNGNGTFTQAANSPVAGGFAPFHAVVGNFNADAFADMVVANLGGGTVTVFLGNGSGGFTQFGSEISAGSFSSYIAVGLYNGDANLDLAVSNRLSNNVTILLGNGNGGFSQAPGSPYPVGAAPMSVSTGDLNLDGILDLAIANENSANTTILLGNGLGGFGSPTTVLKGLLPTHIALADFNEDGKLDIATSDGGDDTVTILLNTCNTCSAIAVNPTTIAAGTVNSSYSATFTPSGGSAPHSFSLTGALPNGLAFTDPTLSGVPTQTGSFPVTVTTTDNNGCAGSRNYTLTVNCQSITVNPTTIASGTVNTFYNQSFTQTGGLGTTTFGVSGTLPTGLSFSGTTISGTPTQSGNFPITVTATDSNGCAGSRAYTLVINCQTSSIVVNPTTVPAGTAGTAYSQTFTQTGGIGTTTFSRTGILPTGMTFSGATLSGAPTQTGSFPITITATDSNGCNGSRNYTLVINCQTITVNPTTIPAGTAGTAGTAYSQTFTQTGGIGTTTFSVTAKQLPAGLTFTGATLSGVPTQTGSFPITVTATDSNGCSGSRNYTLVINCPTIAVNPATLPNGVVGIGYSQTVSATGGIGSYTFAVSAGVLPTGVTLSGASLSGAPTTAGTFNFTLRATDSNGCQGTRAYTVVVTATSTGLQFYPLATPVRLLDTRSGQTACYTPGAKITGNTSRTQLAAGVCSIPAGAKAVVGNITTLQANNTNNFLTLYASDVALPNTTNSNYRSSQTLNNAFTVGLGATDGAFKIYVSGTTHVIVDIVGYYAPPATGGLYYHPLPKPIRLLETRAGQPGCVVRGSALPAGSETTVQGATTCDGVTIPSTAKALYGNATTVSPSGSGFLTLFAANISRPSTANGNYTSGQTLNSPFTVPLSPTGQFKVYTTAQTHLVVDAQGYFSSDAVDVNGQGLLFSLLATPVRLLDTRAGMSACFVTGTALQAGVEQSQLARGTCAINASAQAIVGNATVTNNPASGFLTLWKSDLVPRPLAAASNWTSGLTLNRNFMVGLGADGKFKMYASSGADLIVDVSGYFAP